MPALLRLSRLASQPQTLAPAAKVKPPEPPGSFLTPHDHAALLRVAAKVKHALIVQTLLSHFSAGAAPPVIL